MNLNAVLWLPLVALLSMLPWILALVVLYSVWGTKPLLRQLLEEQRKTNALLEAQGQHRPPAITEVSSR